MVRVNLCYIQTLLEYKVTADVMQSRVYYLQLTAQFNSTHQISSCLTGKNDIHVKMYLRNKKSLTSLVILYQTVLKHS